MRRSPFPPSAEPTPGPAPARLCTADPVLAGHVRALADAVGVPIEVAPDPPPAARRPALLLVGLDAADVAGAAAPALRPDALVVRLESGDPPDGVWRRTVELGAGRLSLLPEDDPWLLDALSEASAPAARAPVVGVLGGCGGAGASGLATALAVTAAVRGLRPVLIDADPVGPGLDVSFGAGAVAGLRWEDLATGPAALRLAASAVPDGLPEAAGVLLLGPGEGAVRSAPDGLLGPAIDAASRGVDVVVVDLPRLASPGEAAAVTRCALLLVVVPACVRAVAAAVRCSAAVLPFAADVRVVVRGPGERGLDGERVADALDLPLAGEVGSEPSLHRALARGEAASWRPRRPLAHLCARLLADVLEPT